MFKRKTSAPSCINCRSVSVFSVAGPSVQMIFVLRTSARIKSGGAKARRFSLRRSRPRLQSCAESFGTVHWREMHQSSFDKMTAFRRDYLETRRHEALVILDLGSQDINGSYRPLFALPPWRYVGIDLAAGNNVKVV